jgi:hypothetical protein
MGTPTESPKEPRTLGEAVDVTLAALESKAPDTGASFRAEYVRLSSKRPPLWRQAPETADRGLFPELSARMKQVLAALSGAEAESK